MVLQLKDSVRYVAVGNVYVLASPAIKVIKAKGKGAIQEFLMETIINYEIFCNKRKHDCKSK